MKFTQTPEELAEKQSRLKWEPFDLDASIRKQLEEIREKAEAEMIFRLELRQKLRQIGR